MGSKKKDKEKERKKRKRDRSSSRSRDRRDKHHRHHHKHKKHKRNREERSPSISLSDLSDFEPELEKKIVQEPVRPLHHVIHLQSPSFTPPPLSPPSRAPPSPPPQQPFRPAASPPLQPFINDEPRGGKEISLSVEETNKIRAKLGLKPLQLTSEVRSETDADRNGGDPSEYKAGEAIHKPAENLRDKIEVEKLREKIAAQRERRKLKERMGKVRTLGESDEEEENVSSWVGKSRTLEKERKIAEMRNKMLEELDEQFGIGDLVEEDMRQTKKKMYDSNNLAGIRVQHDVQRFSEGQTTILTLKDSNVLDNSEDTLVNVNIEDTERVEKNLKRKKAKPDDLLYDTPEVDEFGNIIQNNLLTKYDEEIEGEKKQSFRIGRRGEGAAPEAAPEPENKMAKLRKLASLDMPQSQLATEYLTPEEMVSFRKVKKKKKKKKMFTADDLEPINDGEAHWGSRIPRRIKQEPMEVGSSLPRGFGRNRVKTLRELMEEDDEMEVKEEKNEEEEKKKKMEEEKEDPEYSDGEKDAIELQEALARSRRAKLNAMRKKYPGDAVPGDAAPISQSAEENDEDAEEDTAMTLNLTDEFCRSLGDIPTYGLSGNRADEDAVVIPGDATSSKSAEAWDTQGAWEEVGIEDTKVEISNERNVPILEEEPDTGVGVHNALKLAIKKGYLEKNNDKRLVNATLQHLRAVHYSIEDKAVEEERGRNRGNDRYMGPVMDFKEKDTYKPDVKLEYVDDEGRKLNAKEAFRYLSHKFHGKGSGKNKLEKRMKKWQEELVMKHMSSSDTPLQTLERQREKQKQLGTAYLVLSGSKPQETLDVKK